MHLNTKGMHDLTSTRKFEEKFQTIGNCAWTPQVLVGKKSIPETIIRNESYHINHKKPYPLPAIIYIELRCRLHKLRDNSSSQP